MVWCCDYLDVNFLRMCLHGLQGRQSSSTLHDDFAVIGFAQSEDTESSTALFTHLRQHSSMLSKSDLLQTIL